ncbi:MAG: WYL domain-containing protein [Clostridiales bacterium]|nr:WYL domain-containing protein [Clostridiales bacterium]
MSEDQTPKKHRKREARYFSWQGNKDNRGRKADQKMKPFLTLAYLWKYSDENHVLSARDISHLLAEFYIDAERRSIYRDIKEINRLMLPLEGDYPLWEAEELLENDDTGEYQTIVYDPHRKGYYLQRRPFEFTDIQILAQCICSAKFVSEDQTERLFKSLFKFISEQQAEESWESTLLFEEEKTEKTGVFYNIPALNDAMSLSLNGGPHVPEKIEFDYAEYIIDEMQHRPVLKNINRKTVSPYKFLVSDGNIFLLGFDDSQNQMQTYRIDCISKVTPTGKPRDGQNAYEQMNLQEYVRSNFQSHGNSRRHVSILFENSCLDEVIRRFGTKEAQYATVDSAHFVADVNVEIENAFYNWLLGFGAGAKILKPEWAAEAFLKYIDDIKNTYTTKP